MPERASKHRLTLHAGQAIEVLVASRQTHDCAMGRRRKARWVQVHHRAKRRATVAESPVKPLAKRIQERACELLICGLRVQLREEDPAQTSAPMFRSDAYGRNAAEGQELPSDGRLESKEKRVGDGMSVLTQHKEPLVPAPAVVAKVRDSRVAPATTRESRCMDTD